MSFRIGEVVNLKSGGPSMTVVEVGSYETMGLEAGVHCVWFEGSRKRTPFSTLIHAQASKPSPPRR